MSKAGSRIVLAMLFFSWGLISVLIDMTIPVFKESFELGYFQAFFVQFVYFLAYLFLGRLSGTIVSRVGLKKGTLLGLMFMTIGTLCIVPSTLLAEFSAILGSIFLIACGVTFLQVSANPLAAGFGTSSKSSSQLTLVQGLNSVGTFAAPFLASLLFFNLSGDVSQTAGQLLGVRQVFLSISVMLMVIAFLVYKILDEPTTEKRDALAPEPAVKIIANPVPLLLGAMAIFFYVGAEVSISSVITNYLSAPDILDISKAEAAGYASLYWGGAMCGRFLGAPLLASFGAARVLAISSVIAAGCALLSIAASGVIAAGLILIIGLFNGIQFPTIFALTISGRSIEDRAKASGWLCTGIIGGGIVPLIFGALADISTLQFAFLIPVLCYLYIMIFALIARRRLGDS